MASPTELSTSESGAQHSTVATNASTAMAAYSEQAWHILALLFSIGRPARPSELASRCTFFYMTPSLVEFLCSLPNSPVELTRSYFVTFSSVGYVAIANLAKSSNICENLDFVPRFLGELGLMRQRGVGEQALRTYGRKKRRIDLDGKCLPVERKRSILNKLNAQHEYTIASEFACRTETCSGKAYFSDSNMSKTIAAWPYKSPHISINEWEPDRAMLRKESTLISGNAMFISGVGSAPSWNAIEPTLASTLGSNGIVCAESGGCLLKRPNNNNLYLLTLEAQQQITEAIPEEMVTCLPNIQSHVTSTTAELKDEDHVTMMDVMEISEKACENPPLSSCCAEGPTKNPMTDTTGKQVPPEDTTLDNAANDPIQMITTGDKSSRTPLKSQEILTNPVIPSRPKQQAKSFPKPKLDQKNANSERMKLIAKTLDYGNDTHSLEKQQQLKKYRKSLPLSQSSQRNTDQNGNPQPKMEGTKKHGQSSSTLAPKQLERKALPDFESYVAEEEEGSGGYGTVYRARRKNDGSAFAIKCPHVNANTNHVRNELKMLERFGGKNFIIKYEGSFKDGDSDCLVLEHVEHDRPEVLKREIDVSELQWYGYCLFRALASLHKQGIIHRDVKPGNFLFNRKACKGYLIDFNLALDLHKQGRTEKKRASHDVSLSFTKSLPPTKSRKLQTSKALHLEHQEQGKVPKFALQPKKSKNESEHPKPNYKGGNWSIIKSQGADGSGITSAKDTSTMTLSGEKRKEPIPSHGRKELLSLVQEALHGAKQKEVNGPVTKRKRVEAPAQVVDRKIIYQTPMPLHSAGVAVGGAGLLESKGNGKHNREGPCVGTKGFRAPEVLFRSLYQSPKVDIWSAGVTLLYLITGRSPFTGEPDQNVKEIAKLRGSEDLWEVAKLHGHESLFPQDLHNVKSLSSMKLRDWCKVHTRRPDFLDVIPRSLLDLVDKCLTVNPRLRISAEDALKHDFFTPCHEALRKHRLHRQGVGQDVGPNPLSQVDSQISTQVY